MKSTATLINNFKFQVDNGKDHKYIIDLPENMNGTNAGPTALELSVMSLSGCLATIFAIVAKNSKLDYSKLSVEVNANKPDSAKTIESADAKIYISSTEEKEKIERVLNKTMGICPVGLIFEKASIHIKTELILN